MYFRIKRTDVFLRILQKFVPLVETRETNGGANIYARRFKFDGSKKGAVDSKKQSVTSAITLVFFSIRVWKILCEIVEMVGSLIEFHDEGILKIFGIIFVHYLFNVCFERKSMKLAEFHSVYRWLVLQRRRAINIGCTLIEIIVERRNSWSELLFIKGGLLMERRGKRRGLEIGSWRARREHPQSSRSTFNWCSPP